MRKLSPELYVSGSAVGGIYGMGVLVGGKVAVKVGVFVGVHVFVAVGVFVYVAVLVTGINGVGVMVTYTISGV
jgi:hypothetical protein